MRRSAMTVLAAVALLSGCYRATVVTGAPASATVVDKPWQNSFVYGLVPPPEVNTSQQCPQGVSTVMTEQSFVNGLVRVLTWGIYTPMHARVTCASGPVAR